MPRFLLPLLLIACAAHLQQFLRQRRDRIGAHWFARLNPLDRFWVDGDELRFVDLAVSLGYADFAETSYRYTILAENGATLSSGTTRLPAVSLDPSWRSHGYLVVSLLPERSSLRAEPALVYLRPGEETWSWIGLRRLD